MDDAGNTDVVTFRGVDDHFLVMQVLLKCIEKALGGEHEDFVNPVLKNV